ncbi:MAG: aminotransferase-like domain-containing protein [Alphaproteobacteria bacterium]
MDWEPEISTRRGPRYRRISEKLVQGKRRHLVAGRLGRGGLVDRLRGRAPCGSGEDGALLAEVLRPARPRTESVTQSRLPAPEFIDLGALRPAQGPQATSLAQTLRVLGTQGDLAGYLADAAPAEDRPLRIAGVKWLAGLGIPVAAEHLHPVAGAGQARHAVLAMLGAPGDVILADPATHPGLLPIAALLGLKLHAVMADKDGMLPDSLELACWSTRARLLYLMPTLHNPATTTMPAQRRRELVEIARKYDLRIIEDEVCGVLAEKRIASFTDLAGERTFCITGLELAVASGFRAGFVSAPPAYASALRAAIAAIGAFPAPLLAALTTCWIEDGTAGRLLDWQRRELAARNEIARDMLAGQRFAADAAAPHIWLQLPEPWDAGDFTRRLALRRIVVSPAAKFAPDPAGAPRAVRIALGAAPDRQSLRKGLAGVVEALALTRRLHAV